MILATDTYYHEHGARTVGLLFPDWSSAAIARTACSHLAEVAAYEPGAFYKRELPCILKLLEAVDLREVEAVVIDGYVYLDDAGTPGLGQHLYERLEAALPVIGVAKTSFAPLANNKRAVLRGTSTNPLYVTAVGTDLEEAADRVRNMHGPHRIPTLLKHLDGLTRATDRQPPRHHR